MNAIFVWWREELDVVIHARTEIVKVLGEKRLPVRKPRQVIRSISFGKSWDDPLVRQMWWAAISMVKNDVIDKFDKPFTREKYIKR